MRCAWMYLGKELNYIECYPNEAYILLHNKKLHQKKELSEQLSKIFRDIRNTLSSDNQSMVIVGRSVSTVEELLAQQKRMKYSAIMIRLFLRTIIIQMRNIMRKILSLSAGI